MFRALLSEFNNLFKLHTRQPVHFSAQSTFSVSRRRYSSAIIMKRSQCIDQETESYGNPLKKQNGAVLIGTHDGVFHCDEALACYMLKLLPEYKDVEIVRTRDENLLKQCDIVVDVGAKFNPDNKLFDHHQREFNSSLSMLRPELGDKYSIKLSSAGLIYTYYGERVIQAVAPEISSLYPNDQILIYKKVYEKLIEEIDAIDNGVAICEGKPKYNIRSHISARVGRLNPEWNSMMPVDELQLFKEAMALIGEEFVYHVKHLLNVWLPARIHVKEALDKRFSVHSSGQILEFVGRFPWKQHLFELETDMELTDHKKKILYVIFSDKTDSWRVQAVPIEPTSFIARKSLRKDWWGLRDEQLSKVSGIEGSIFCHSTGFIAGCKTKDWALRMAIKSLETDDSDLISTFVE